MGKFASLALVVCVLNLWIDVPLVAAEAIEQIVPTEPPAQAPTGKSSKRLVQTTDISLRELIERLKKDNQTLLRGGESFKKLVTLDPKLSEAFDKIIRKVLEEDPAFKKLLLEKKMISKDTLLLHELGSDLESSKKERGSLIFKDGSAVVTAMIAASKSGKLFWSCDNPPVIDAPTCFKKGHDLLLAKGCSFLNATDADCNSHEVQFEHRKASRWLCTSRSENCRNNVSIIKGCPKGFEALQEKDRTNHLKSQVWYGTSLCVQGVQTGVSSPDGETKEPARAKTAE